MNLIRKRIKYHLDEVKKEKGHDLKSQKKQFVIIKLLFDTEVFFSKCSSIGDFMKKLKNGKISFENIDNIERPKQNNREYFNSIIDGGGFYRYNFTYKFIEFHIYLELKGEIDENIDKKIITSRISKIVKPLEIKIGFNDRLLLDKTFRDLTLTETGWNVFGDEFRNKTI